MKAKMKTILFAFFIFLLPTQFGKHFFLPFSYINGIRVDYLSFVLYSTDILALLLILFHLKILFQTFQRNWKWLLVFFLLFSINTVFSNVPQIALYEDIKILEIICVFILFKTFKNHSLFLYSLTVGTIVELILGIAQIIYKTSIQGVFYFLGERYFTLSQFGIAKVSLQGVEILRPYATFSHPNSLGGFYLLIYFFTLLFTPFKQSKYIKYVLLFATTLLILFSFSKAAIGVYILGNSIYLFFFSEIHCMFCKISRMITTLVLGFIFAVGSHDSSGNQKRIDLINHSFIILKNHLFFGTGLGNYLYYEKDFPAKTISLLNQPVHNIFLLFFTESGIVLGTASILFLFWLFKNQKKSILFWFCIASVLITGILDHYWLTLQQNFLLLGVIFGILSQKIDLSSRPKSKDL